MIVADLIDRFAQAGIESPAAEAASLLAELAGTGRTQWISPNRPIPENRDGKLREWTARRCAGEPLPYISGIAYFMELELEVTRNTLIPRPETELMVEYLRKTLPPRAHLLELGTGSGAIALGTAAGRPDITVTAVELIPETLAVACRNRARCRLEDRVRMIQGDLFAPVADERFDFLAANLPYVSEQEYSALPRSVRDWEPRTALTAPDNGLALTLESARRAPGFLRTGAGAIWEIGETQGARLRAAFAAMHGWTNIHIRPDRCGRDRFITAFLEESL